MIACFFYFHQAPWNGPTDKSTHLNRDEKREGGGREEERGVTREGPERLLKGVPPFVLFVEAFLFSFLLPFERRVKTK